VGCKCGRCGGIRLDTERSVRGWDQRRVIIIRLTGNGMVLDMLGVRLPLEMVNTAFSLFTDCLFSFDRRSSPPK
jgi:hypothetical protein